MTEVEAREFAAHLERVWQPQGGVTVESDTKNFAFVLLVDATAQLDIWVDETYNERVFWLSDTVVEMGFLSCRWPSGELDLDWLSDGHSNYLLTRQQQWLHRFRRGCWLSGCAIEATVHEKVEWMQGFTREEIETWNLQI